MATNNAAQAARVPGKECRYGISSMGSRLDPFERIRADRRAFMAWCRLKRQCGESPRQTANGRNLSLSIDPLSCRIQSVVFAACGQQ